MEYQKRYRRFWGRTETLALLEGYSKHKAEFEIPRKRKKAYSNLLEELTRNGVLEELTTTDMLDTRIKSLLRAYKSSLRNPDRRAAPCVAPYLWHMEKIFGSNQFTLIEDNSRSSYELIDVVANSTPEREMKKSPEPYSSCAAESTFHPASSSAGAECARSETPEEKTNLRHLYLSKKIAMAEKKLEQRQQLLQIIENHYKEVAVAKQRRHVERLALKEQRHRQKFALIERQHREKLAVIERLLEENKDKSV